MNEESQIVGNRINEVEQAYQKAIEEGVEDPIVIVHQQSPQDFLIAGIPRAYIVEGMRANGVHELADDLERLRGSESLTIAVTLIDGSASVIELKPLSSFNQQPELN